MYTDHGDHEILILILALEKGLIQTTILLDIDRDLGIVQFSYIVLGMINPPMHRSKCIVITSRTVNQRIGR